MIQGLVAHDPEGPEAQIEGYGFEHFRGRASSAQGVKPQCDIFCIQAILQSICQWKQMGVGVKFQLASCLLQRRDFCFL